MPELADIFRSAGPAYRAARGDRLLPSQRRAMTDIVACRTATLGGSLYTCDDCGAFDYRYHSCRNRHCPKCQQDRAQDWLTRLRARLLPCDHYLLTFTLPQELRALALSHQKQVYHILLREAAAVVQALAHDPAGVGGALGILAMLTPGHARSPIIRMRTCWSPPVLSPRTILHGSNPLTPAFSRPAMRSRKSFAPGCVQR